MNDNARDGKINFLKLLEDPDFQYMIDHALADKILLKQKCLNCKNISIKIFKIL